MSQRNLSRYDEQHPKNKSKFVLLAQLIDEHKRMVEERTSIEQKESELSRIWRTSNQFGEE
jgi:hypothetical protein